MPQSVVNGINIAWEQAGPESGPVICLVHGLGMPLTAWPAELLDGLVLRGYRIIVMDNRDIGQSQLMSQFRTPNFIISGLRRKMGLKVHAPYRLEDMAADTAALLRSLDVQRAHVVGVSMGGMIAQLLAIHEPGLVASLTSIMSTSGNRSLPGPDPEVARHIFSRPVSRSKEDRVAFNLKTWRMISSPGYPSDEADKREFILRNLERGVTAAGIGRQTLAIMAAPSRVTQLRQVKVPSLVIHGREDRLVKVTCGEDTARSIPGCRLHVFPGMGHDLPVPLIDTFAELIDDLARAADAAMEQQR
jgi:pimeloyl-ACP methyl ester carboxylesterase